MRQIISGETHKKQIVNKKQITDSLEKIYSDVEKNIESCVYENGMFIQDKYLNFLNIDSGNNLSRQVKLMLRNAYDECESLYPYLGDVFLQGFFSDRSFSSSLFFKFNKENETDLIENISVESIKMFCKWFLKYCSLERNIQFEYVNCKDLIVKKNNDVTFDFLFDYDFLGDKQSYTMKKYRYVVVDGFIESQGEIHHLMHKAAKTKNPYVIFCFGMSDEVKKLVIENNKRGITEIFPVCIKFDESSVNILNDIAVLHNCEVVSALKGQTISQALRKELPVGKRIQIFRKKIVIKPVCSERKINNHRKFLFERVDEIVSGKNNSSKDVILSRLKNFSSKNINLYIPEIKKNDITFKRELNYLLKFFSCTCYVMGKVSLGARDILIPAIYINLVQNKITNIKEIISKIDTAILITNASKIQ